MCRVKVLCWCVGRVCSVCISCWYCWCCLCVCVGFGLGLV